MQVQCCTSAHWQTTLQLYIYTRSSIFMLAADERQRGLVLSRHMSLPHPVQCQEMLQETDTKVQALSTSSNMPVIPHSQQQDPPDCASIEHGL